MKMDRRTAMTAMAGAAAAPLAGSQKSVAASTNRAAPASAVLDFSAPAVRLDALVRMRGALDDRLVISFLEGVYYGVMQARITPLYGLSAALFRQYRKRPDGGFDYANLELVYVTDLDTGGLLEEFRNPYSGNTGKPPQTRLGPSRLTITPALEVQRPGQTPGHGAVAGADAARSSGFHRFRAPRVVGDDVWIVEESSLQAPPPLNFAFNEVLTYRASLKALSDRGLLHVPTEVQFHPVIGWRPWQGMDGFDGPPSHVMGVCAGRVVTSIDALPERYRKWTARFHPDVLADPLRLLAGVWTNG